MRPPVDLLAAYLRQRAEAGEGNLVLEPAPLGTPAVAASASRPARATRADGTRRAGRAAHEAEPSGPGAPRPQPKWLRDAPPIPVRGLVVPAPPKDLFTADPLAGLGLTDIAERVHACRKCALCEARQHAVPGEGPADAKLVVVGEGPGATEDETGRPFVGRAGELLTEILAAIDLPRERVFICNVVKCRPPGNRKPQPDEIAACVPFLYRQLEIIGPAVILAMGGTAAETLLNSRQPLAALRERVHEFRGTPLVVTYHPAALLRNPHWKKPTWDDVRIARRLLDAR